MKNKTKLSFVFIVTLFFSILMNYVSCSEPLNLDEVSNNSSNDSQNSDSFSKIIIKNFKSSSRNHSDVNTSPTFSWEPINLEVEYQIEIRDTITNEVIIPWQQTQDLDNFQFSNAAFESEKLYSAFIRAVNNENKYTQEVKAIIENQDYWSTAQTVSKVVGGFQTSCLIQNGGAKC